MSISAYIISYLTLWTSVLAFGLALCRLKVSNYKYQIMLSTIPLPIMAVVTQYFKQAHWFGLLQPIALTLCYWKIFNFRLFHAFLVGLSVFASGGLSETFFNWVMAGFHIEQSLLNQQTDRGIMAVLMAGYHVGLYFILQHYRIGFSFIAPSRLPSINQQTYPRSWLYLNLGFLCSLGLFNLAIYFSKTLYFVFVTLSIICWLVVLYISYIKEIHD
ncbi:hypothetical protein SAMN02799630_00774 [Paenibacillus sp. UNCCL117]|uniref:hypothetical protein n=1 Tax=unclassified Paenibacillus TaxID=185978 RepID=UPI00088F78E5|nr:MULTISPECIES: hypothetical protein [unclassified Paenibacillus]SDC19774.1 hypothetical protein SAMN04488602_101574 [Paenibacillus sp. cl123]SFW18479.1 hypothetical protein SAMN02799630_00774 [Paenibacillus sp. UNCCL117]